MAADVAEYAKERLESLSAVTDLVMDGASGIFESGDLDMAQLSKQETARRDAGTSTKLLAIVVQDTGEVAADELHHDQRVTVWLYDRQRGYTNIRTVRKQVYAALEGRSSALTDPLTGRSVMVKLLFDRRSGHLHERRMTVDYETITFVSEVFLES